MNGSEASWSEGAAAEVVEEFLDRGLLSAATERRVRALRSRGDDVAALEEVLKD
ncbi:hypothetical protein GRS48_01035 [Halorubrum sp. JWXQ-INN 858]|uniref:hypothetical protein n=1 Tax=Halorubrum sp. JWXQ-INN 858 TaxID=2690782 RepID=UPI001359662A|nr:hypothetical protein [Halorubrum sp. JWXQ-INN 858]MWV63419.1 hypothetical protein [Halorubrum sp. JWXQ-INN 858]